MRHAPPDNWCLASYPRFTEMPYRQAKNLCLGQFIEYFD